MSRLNDCPKNEELFYCSLTHTKTFSPQREDMQEALNALHLLKEFSWPAIFLFGGRFIMNMVNGSKSWTKLWKKIFARRCIS